MARAALSLMPEAELLAAILPLLAEGAVDALEWSPDLGWGAPLPGWVAPLLGAYSTQGALYGHGVRLSMLSAEPTTPRQHRWLDCLRAEVEARRFVHVSEHFGWSTAGGLDGAPLPLPRSATALRVGQARLAELAAACGRPVGLENLALALSARDVEALPDFLEALVAPLGGFVLLDLHNLWCQAVNFGLDPERLLRRYPPARVRELHISGGSWATAAGRRFRRDTHDDAVPPPVMALLDAALDSFPAVEVVTLERMHGTLSEPAAQLAFADDFRAMRARCQAHIPVPSPLPAPLSAAETAETAAEDVVELEALAQDQAAWLHALARGAVVEGGALAGWRAAGDLAAKETVAVLAARWLRRSP